MQYYSQYPTLIEFQFLIGRLKTNGRCIAYKKFIGFQFLIGRLKTEETETNIRISFCFNSL